MAESLFVLAEGGGLKDARMTPLGRKLFDHVSGLRACEPNRPERESIRVEASDRKKFPRLCAHVHDLERDHDRAGTLLFLRFERGAKSARPVSALELTSTPFQLDCAQNRFDSGSDFPRRRVF
jgi:hypothetical protein